MENEELNKKQENSQEIEKDILAETSEGLIEEKQTGIVEKTPKKRIQMKSFFAGIIIGLLLATLTVTVTLFGKQIYLQYVLAKSADGTDASSAETSVVNASTLSKMKTIEELIDENYYLSDIDESTLEDGVYDGMMEALGDKYARYYSAEELSELEDENAGIYYGIGAYVGLDEDTSMPYISSVIEDTPAEEAGLRADDIIYAVDGTSTYDMELDDVVSLIKGDEGTTVTLTILRDDETMDVDVTRAKVNTPTVTYKMLDDDIGYIQITEFDDITVDQFTDAYATIKGSDAKALILDLRGNPGGLLTSVVSIAQQILPEGLIVYTEDKDGNKEEYTSDGSNEIQIPLVVLVNGNSASAAEILTGAIKDDGVGTIVGTTTYGKGIVQKLFPLSDGSAVKMTVSAYYTPNGTNIQGTGIEPDVTVEFDSDAYYDSDKTEDNQLEKAEEILEEQISK